MKPDETLSAFGDELVKLASPNLLQRGLGAAGKAIKPIWGKVDDAAEGLFRMGTKKPSVDMSFGNHLLTGAARAGVGAGVGAGVSEDGHRLRGALTGAAAGAALPSVLRGTHNVGVAAGRLLKNPIRTSQASWRSQSPTWKATDAAGEHYKNVSKYEKAVESPATELKARYLKARANAHDPGSLSTWWHGSRGKAIAAKNKAVDKNYAHLIDKNTGNVIEAGQPLLGNTPGVRNRISAAAGELSRRGWTGQGNITKYLPVGNKGQTAIFAGLSAPTIYGAATGENSMGEAAGEIGSNLGFMVGGGLPGMGMVGTMGLSELARRGFETPVNAMAGK